MRIAVKASLRDFASLVKGGGLPQGKPEGFCLPCKGRWVAVKASRRDSASLVKGGGLP